jgi:hypothetical protein
MRGMMMMQMMAKAGIKKHGQVTIYTLFQELLQLHDLGDCLAQDWNKLMKKEKKAALRPISMVKKKRCGKIKERTVAHGRPQQRIYTKQDPSTHALMMSILIDTKERISQQQTLPGHTCTSRWKISHS